MLTVCLDRRSKYEAVRPVKSIKFGYAAWAEISSLFEDFMCNDAIRIASRFGLIKQAYPRLKEYSLHIHSSIGLRGADDS
jgi:hypothetical protein